jgi:hypothetical protein
MNERKRTAFEAAGAEKQAGLLKEFFAMVKQYKMYWLVPIVLILLAFGLLILLGGTSIAPFIYTIF